MGDGRRHYVEYPMARTGYVVHEVNKAAVGLGFTCGGRHALSQTEGLFEPAVVSCLWCIAGIRDEKLRWFKWGDGT